MEYIGKTTDGKVVVSGLFELFSTHGLPLADVFFLCRENGQIPNWIEFYKEVQAGGWSHKTIINRLSDSISDIYGKEFSEVVIQRLNQIFQEK